MRPAGQAVSAAQGLCVLRTPEPDPDEDDSDGTPDPPAIGTEVVDDSLNRVGDVVDVFGPVDRPYLAVSPDDGVDPGRLVGSRLYAKD